MTGGQVAVGVDVGVDDVAVVVLHRTPGGCWQVESATGRAEDIAAVMTAAAPPPPKLPDHLTQGPTLAQQAIDWMRERTQENFDLDAEQLDLLRRMYSRNLTAGRILHVTNAYEPERRSWADDVVRAHLFAGRAPEQFERYYANELLEGVNAPADRRHHP